MKIFNRTLIKKISAPPQPLLDPCEPINRTLHENFSAGSDEIFSGPENFLRAVPKENLKKFAMANAKMSRQIHSPIREHYLRITYPRIPTCTITAATATTNIGR
ncbi:MAG: hypothetical protein ABFD07_01395, partial [Methanobacterium sp.]